MRWYGRLRRSSEIAFVRRRGRQAGSSFVVGYGAAAERGETVIAVTVAKTVGGAVVRNRVRRRIRGALDALAPLPAALRLVLVAKPAAASASYEELARDARAVLGRLSAPR